MSAVYEVPVGVLPMTQARAALAEAADRFREIGLSADPVIFGNHRKPEGVVMPYALYERLLPAIEELLLAELVRARIADGRERVDGAALMEDLGFSPDAFA
jgi:antitoxin StbD